MIGDRLRTLCDLAYGSASSDPNRWRGSVIITFANRDASSLNHSGRTLITVTSVARWSRKIHGISMALPIGGGLELATTGGALLDAAAPAAIHSHTYVCLNTCREYSYTRG